MFDIVNRYRPRSFDQVGHQTTSVYIENKHFSLNDVIVRPTKIMNNLLKNCIKNQPNLADFFTMKNITLGDQILLVFFFENLMILKVLYFLKMCPIFDDSSSFGLAKSEKLL